MAKKKPTKKRNQTDLTLRNLHPTRREIEAIVTRMAEFENRLSVVEQWATTPRAPVEPPKEAV